MRFKPYTLAELKNTSNPFRMKTNPRLNWLNHLSDKTREILKRGKRIKIEEYLSMKGNSYDWKTIYPMLETKALINCVEENLKYCTTVERAGRYSVDSVYEDALVNTLAPIVLDRLEELEKENERLKDLIAARRTNL